MGRQLLCKLAVCLYPGLLLLLPAGCTAPQATAPPAMAQTAPLPAAVTPPPVERPRATGTPEDARRHLLRGAAAIEIARSEAELALAADEFRMATEIAPEMAEAWFNLGAVQEKMTLYKDAADSYREYLALVPEAEDAPRLRDHLIKLEFREELQARSIGRAGLWVDQEGNLYQAVVNGDRLVFDGTRHVPQTEIGATYTLVGKIGATAVEKVNYQLVPRGSELTGVWTRSEAKCDACTVPGEKAEVTGQIDDARHRLTLRYPRTLFKAAVQMSLMSNDYCREVTALGKKDVEMTLYGPLPAGGVGIGLDGFHSWWDGGFSAIQFGWQGRIRVNGIAQGSPAWIAGLRDKDEIIYIDGVAVKQMSPAQVFLALRGEPGTRVVLQVSRGKSDQLRQVPVNRIDLRKTAQATGQ